MTTKEALSSAIKLYGSHGTVIAVEYVTSRGHETRELSVHVGEDWRDVSIAALSRTDSSCDPDATWDAVLAKSAFVADDRIKQARAESNVKRANREQRERLAAAGDFDVPGRTGTLP